MENLQTAVIIPCFNEEASIAAVIKDFKKALPKAEIYVFDNNSTDKTAEIAEKKGAVVRKETLAGKGNVVRRMFADVNADVYVMVDGDDTYNASDAANMIDKLISENLDMVVAVRKEDDKEEGNPYRIGHRTGNMFFNWVVKQLFGNQFSDIFSGYRVFSRRFVKSFPALSRGFEIETELSIHCLDLRLPTAEIPSVYRARQEGSESKLNTFKDGFRILMLIMKMLKEVRPMFFFTSIALLVLAVALFLGIPLILTYLDTGLVPRYPTAILTMGLTTLSGISFVCGVILDSLSNGRRDFKRLFYLYQKEASERYRQRKY